MSSNTFTLKSHLSPENKLVPLVMRTQVPFKVLNPQISAPPFILTGTFGINPGGGVAPGAVVQVGKLLGASFDASQGSDQEIILSSGTGKPFIVEMIIAANFSGETSQSYFYFYTGPLGTGYFYGYVGYIYGGTADTQVMSSIQEQDDVPISMPALADGDTLYANQAGTPEAITVDLYVYGRLLT